MATGRGIAYIPARYGMVGLEDIAKIKLDMDASFVILAMTEQDLRYNVGGVAEQVKIAKDGGLDVWLSPWGLGSVFSGEVPSFAVAEWTAAHQLSGTNLPLPALCPSSACFWSLMAHWLSVAGELQPHRILLDNPHWAVGPTNRTRSWWSCRCKGCVQEYQMVYDEPMPTEWESRLKLYYATRLADTIKKLAGEAHAEYNLPTAVLMAPDADTDLAFLARVAGMDGVDYVGTQTYWYEGRGSFSAQEFEIRRVANLAISACENTSAKPFIMAQAFRVPAGREHELAPGIEIAVESGVESVAIWGYEGGEAFESWKSDDPEAVWKNVHQAFGLLKREAMVRQTLRSASEAEAQRAKAIETTRSRRRARGQ